MNTRLQPTDLRVVVIEDESDSVLVIHTALQVGGVDVTGDRRVLRIFILEIHVFLLLDVATEPLRHRA